MSENRGKEWGDANSKMSRHGKRDVVISILYGKVTNNYE